VADPLKVNPDSHENEIVSFNDRDPDKVGSFPFVGFETGGQ